MSLTKRKLIELIFENKKISSKKYSISNNDNLNKYLNQRKNKLVILPNKSENEMIIKNKSLNISEYNNLNYINNNITIIRNNNSEQFENNNEKNNFNNNNTINNINNNNNIFNNTIKSSLN